MSNFEKSHGLYVGRVLGSEGKNKKDEPFKRWVLSFKGREDAENAYKVTFFEKADKPFPKIEEGKWYTLTYVVQEYTNDYGPQKGRNLTKVEDGKLPLPEKQTQSAPAPAPAKIIPVNWDDFAKEYDALMDANESLKRIKHPLHMFGVYIANNHAAQFADIVSECKAHFKK